MTRDDTGELFGLADEEGLVRRDEPSPFAQPGIHTEQSAGEAGRPATLEGILATLERMERSLGDVRRLLDGTVRERRHREFSPARLIGSILQALVIGLVLWAVSDWAFGEPHDTLLIKLAFGAVLQLSALTAFILGREVA